MILDGRKEILTALYRPRFQPLDPKLPEYTRLAKSGEVWRSFTDPFYEDLARVGETFSRTNKAQLDSFMAPEQSRVISFNDVPLLTQRSLKLEGSRLTIGDCELIWDNMTGENLKLELLFPKMSPALLHAFSPRSSLFAVTGY